MQEKKAWCFVIGILLLVVVLVGVRSLLRRVHVLLHDRATTPPQTPTTHGPTTPIGFQDHRTITDQR